MTALAAVRARAFTLGPALLFCPGDRPERFVKAAARADTPILDLEDAVAPRAKDEARAHVVEALRGGMEGLRPEKLVVRVNAPASEAFEADLQALSASGAAFVVVPKCDSAQQLDRVAEMLPEAGLIPQVETPLGVLRVEELARHQATAALFWGTEDLIAGLGGTTARGPRGGLRSVIRGVRENVLLTAAAYKLPAIDTIYANLRGTQVLADEAADACAMGFIAKACIHPDQVGTVRAAYTPADEDVEWAKGLTAACEERVGTQVGRTAGGRAEAAARIDYEALGAFTFRGKMIDAPVIQQAQRILHRYAATLPSTWSSTRPSTLPGALPSTRGER